MSQNTHLHRLDMLLYGQHYQAEYIPYKKSWLIFCTECVLHIYQQYTHLPGRLTTGAQAQSKLIKQWEQAVQLPRIPLVPSQQVVYHQGQRLYQLHSPSGQKHYLEADFLALLPGSWEAFALVPGLNGIFTRDCYGNHAIFAQFNPAPIHSE